MNDNTQAKKSVLEEIIKMMDERMDNKLKSKSPKFMQKEPEASEESEKSESEDGMESLKAKLMGDEESPKHKITMPGEDASEDDSDEDKERLLELYSKLK